MTCSIEALSCCQKSPASSCTISIITMCYFWLLSTSHVASSFPRQPWYEGRKLFFPLPCPPLPLPSARCRCRLRPRCGGVSRRFSLVLLIFLGKRLSIQSFMWEASCWHPEYMSQICPASLSDHSAKEPPVSNLLMGDGVPVSSARSLL